MRSLEGYIVPATVTLLLHAALLAALTMNWQSSQEPLVKPAPRHVKARIVSLEKSGAKAAARPAAVPPKPQPPKPEPPKPKPEPPKPKPEPPKPAPAPPPPKPQPKPTPKPQPKPKPVPPKPKPEPPKPDPKVQEEARKKEQVRREAEQRQQQQREQQVREQKVREQKVREQQRLEQEMALAMAAEDEALAEGAETTTYEEAIAMAIEDNWSRPPSARRDMQVVLRIQLIPTGEVVGVSVLKSSGDQAFDRSAINAVNKATRFPEVAEAPPQVFERRLRSLQLVFRPEDLRQ
ncbi:MAG TPA: energy transducer TonB [Pseudomonadales bacterium]|nr:energy transducer TonB [Pseudomonadales bacterium]